MGFVGRERELAGLREQLELVWAGEPRLVAVTGEAGIGKTALVRRFVGTADGVRVLWASGAESEAQLPYGVVAQLGSIPDAGADPLVVGSALLDVLGEAQDAGPVAVVVDDAQWADLPSARALTFALRRLRVDRVLAVVIARDVVPRLPESLRRLLAADTTARLPLTGLSAAELGALSPEPLLGRAAGRLWAHTEGNPLHAVALISQVPAAVLADPHVPLPVPRSFEQLVLARLDGCGPWTRGLLAAASVLGRSCALHDAAGLADVGDPLAALEEAMAAGLVSGRPARVGMTVEFTHPLVHTAVYQGMGPRRRADLHLLASELAGAGPAGLRHRVAAAGGPDADLAAELAEVGRGNAADGWWAEAAGRLAQAARFAVSGPERARLVAEAVEALLHDGQYAELVALAGDLGPEAEPAVHGYVHGTVANVTGRARDATRLLAEAWRACDPAVEPALAGRIAEQLMFSYLSRGRASEGVTWAEHALELAAHRPGADRLWTNYLLCLVSSGAIRRGLRLTADLPDPARAGPRELDGLLGRGLLLAYADDLAEAVRVLSGVVEASRERSHQFRLAGAVLLSLAEYRLGHWDEADWHAEAAVSLADDGPRTWVTAMAHGYATRVPAARGEWERAAAHAKAARAGATTSVAGLMAAAVSHAHLAHARGETRRLVADLVPWLGAIRKPGDPALLLWHEYLVDALVTEGDLAKAEEVLRQYEELARAHTRHSALAAAARLRGNLHAARGEPAAAERSYRDGLAHAARVAGPFDRARLDLDYGAFLRSRNHPAAVERLRSARAVLARLGAHPYLSRCDRELTACGRPPPGTPAPVATLTPQELAIARLVAEGLTNRQVARNLVLSVKTIEYHLGRIYGKLRISSRAALATHVARARPSSEH